MSTGKAANEEHRVSARMGLTRTGALGMAAGRAEGMPLQSMSMFALPGVHTGLMPSLRDGRADPVFKRALQDKLQSKSRGLHHGPPPLSYETRAGELDQEGRTSRALVRSEISLRGFQWGHSELMNEP